MRPASPETTAIYYSDSIIEDSKTLASLCLFHDQILLFSSKPLAEERDALAEKATSDAAARARYDAITAFLDGPYPVLSRAGILELLSSDECSQVFPAAGSIEVTPDYLLDVARLGPPLHRGAPPSPSEAVRINPAGKLSINLGITVGDLIRLLSAWSVARVYRIPLVSDVGRIRISRSSSPTSYMQELTDYLARSSLCQLAIPAIEAINSEQILSVRDAFRSELYEFRAGIAKLAWQLRQLPCTNKNTPDLAREVDAMVATLVQPSMREFENRMRTYHDKRLSRRLLGAGRVLVDVARVFVPGGLQEQLISGGKAILQAATEVQDVKPPEEQVVSYLYHVGRGLRRHPRTRR